MPKSVQFSSAPLFKSVGGNSKAAWDDISRRFWFRVGDAPSDVQVMLSQVYAQHGCQLVHSHGSEFWTKLKGQAFNDSIAEGEEAQSPSDSGVLADIEFQNSHPIYSFSADTVCDARAMQHCSAIEWLMISTDGSRQLSNLSPLVMNLPIDVTNAKRLKQRVQILRGAIHEEARVGVGATLSALIENLKTILDLDIDCVTAIAASSLLAESHPARGWIDEQVSDQVHKLVQMRDEMGRKDVAIALQAPLRSGYDAAAYLEIGVESIILNGWDCMAGVGGSSSSAEAFASSFLGVSAQQHIIASHQRQVEDRVKHFFDEIKDFRTYIGL